MNLTNIIVLTNTYTHINVCTFRQSCYFYWHNNFFYFILKGKTRRDRGGRVRMSTKVRKTKYVIIFLRLKICIFKNMCHPACECMCVLIFVVFAKDLKAFLLNLREKNISNYNICTF